ncbi:MAG: PorT family protein [Saprospiraceae bacterium]|nr:PorT family protein [Saprospiraceae bacterium]
MKVKFGLRAGANFTTLLSNDVDNADAPFESTQMRIRIGIAALAQIPFSDRFGLNPEIAFSQRGFYYQFDGASYLKIPVTSQTFEGHQRTVGMNIINGYVSTPIMFYAKVLKSKKLQFDLGVAPSFLVSSRGLGVLKYTDSDHPDDILEYDLNFRYMKDQTATIVGSGTRTGKIDGTTINHPQTIGAYYLNDEKTSNLYRTFDIGAVAGVSYFFTPGLRFGARAYYGFLDVTENLEDIQQSSLSENREFIYRTDKDRNFGVEVFIGLQF